MKKIFYIEPTNIFSNSAHSYQIDVNCSLINKFRKNLTLISYEIIKTKKLQYSHVAFRRPKIFKKMIPLSCLDLIYKTNKNVSISKDDSIITL